MIYKPCADNDVWTGVSSRLIIRLSSLFATVAWPSVCITAEATYNHLSISPFPPAHVPSLTKTQRIPPHGTAARPLLRASALTFIQHINLRLQLWAVDLHSSCFTFSSKQINRETDEAKRCASSAKKKKKKKECNSEIPNLETLLGVWLHLELVFSQTRIDYVNFDLLVCSCLSLLMKVLDGDEFLLVRSSLLFSKHQTRQ